MKKRKFLARIQSRLLRGSDLLGDISNNETPQPPQDTSTNFVLRGTGYGTIQNRPTKIKLVIVLFSIVLVVLLGMAIYTYVNKQVSDSPTQGTVLTTFPAANVGVTKDGFIPSYIRIKKGQQIVWTNTDSSPHQIAADPYPNHESLPGLFSDALSKDESYGFTFEKTGTFTYHDYLNPLKLQATVVVEE